MEFLSRVADFQYLYKDERLHAYDHAANPDRLNCWQLLPNGLSWTCDRRYLVEFQEKGIACLLPDKSGIAVVEVSLAPYENRLYFLNSRNCSRPHGALPREIAHLSLAPDQVFLSGDLVKVIYVDTTCKPYDYQIDYDPTDLGVVAWNYWK